MKPTRSHNKAIKSFASLTGTSGFASRPLLLALEGLGMHQRIKIRLDFRSVVSIATLIGFCAGVLGAPFQLLSVFTDQETGLGTAILFAALSPILGLVNGFLLGVFAYPCYWYITQKIGFTYSGTIHAVE